jgi:hypothetical protein
MCKPSRTKLSWSASISAQKKLSEALQVVVDCLDPSNTDVKALTFPKEGVFTSQQPEDSSAIIPTLYNVDGRGYGFEIPDRQVVEDTLKRIRELELSIESNRAMVVRETKRQAKMVLG